MKRGDLARTLANTGIEETFIRRSNTSEPNSHVMGSVWINRVQVSQLITNHSTSVLPCNFSAGDYRVHLTDLHLDSMFDEQLPPMCRPQLCCLITSNFSLMSNNMLFDIRIRPLAKYNILILHWHLLFITLSCLNIWITFKHSNIPVVYLNIVIVILSNNLFTRKLTS